MKILDIQEAIKLGNIAWVDHAVDMIRERSITRSDVKKAILNYYYFI